MLFSRNSYVVSAIMVRKIACHRKQRPRLLGRYVYTFTTSVTNTYFFVFVFIYAGEILKIKIKPIKTADLQPVAGHQCPYVPRVRQYVIANTYQPRFSFCSRVYYVFYRLMSFVLYCLARHKQTCELRFITEIRTIPIK